MSVSGTIRKFSIGGVTYDVPADVNITFNLSGFETEGVATTGKTLHKMTRRVQTMEGLVLITDSDEAKALQGVAQSIADTTMSIELADGAVWKTTGKINYENWETEENRSAIQVIPAKSKDAWTLISAP